METYILRVYRRTSALADDVGTTHGTLELVGATGRFSFSSRDELWALLGAPFRQDPSRTGEEQS